MKYTSFCVENLGSIENLNAQNIGKGQYKFIKVSFNLKNKAEKWGCSTAKGKWNIPLDVYF